MEIVFYPAIVLFIVQIVTVFFVIVYSYYWLKYKSRNELNDRLGFGGKSKRTETTNRELIENLPVLVPLNCTNCGAGVLLSETTSICPHCENTADLPNEYIEVLNSRSEVSKIKERFFRYWRFYYFFTLRYSTHILVVAFIAEIVLPFFVGNWANYNQTLGYIWSYFQVPSIIGIICFALLFLVLAVQSSEIGKGSVSKPIFATFAASEKTSNCRSCGGAIQYNGSDFMVACKYCNVSNFRVKFSKEDQIANEQKIAGFESSLTRVQDQLKERLNLILGAFWVFGGSAFLILSFFFVVGGIVGTLSGEMNPFLGITIIILSITVFVYIIKFLNLARKFVF